MGIMIPFNLSSNFEFFGSFFQKSPWSFDKFMMLMVLLPLYFSKFLPRNPPQYLSMSLSLHQLPSLPFPLNLHQLPPSITPS